MVKGAKKISLREKLLGTFGFTREGTSLLGQWLSRITYKRGIRKTASLTLLLMSFLVLIYNSTRNIGGTLGLTISSPRPVIDATTLSSIQLPMDFAYQSRGFGWFHSGVDLVGPSGTPVNSIMEGEVVEINYDRFGYGQHIIVVHEQGYSSLYAHLSKINVSPGDKITLASELGKSGSTGLSTGPHLHLETLYNGITINPKEIVPGVN